MDKPKFKCKCKDRNFQDYSRLEKKFGCYVCGGEVCELTKWIENKKPS